MVIEAYKTYPYMNEVEEFYWGAFNLLSHASFTDMLAFARFHSLDWDDTDELVFIVTKLRKEQAKLEDK